MAAEDADMRTPLQVGVHKPDCLSHLRGLLSEVRDVALLPSLWHVSRVPPES